METRVIVREVLGTDCYKFSLSDDNFIAEVTLTGSQVEELIKGLQEVKEGKYPAGENEAFELLV